MGTKVGTHRDNLDKSRIMATTFHPFQDIWYAAYQEPDDRYSLLTVTDGTVSEVAPCRDVNHAMEWLIQRWTANAEQLAEWREHA